jgi:hypothetical protein
MQEERGVAPVNQAMILLLLDSLVASQLPLNQEAETDNPSIKTVDSRSAVTSLALFDFTIAEPVGGHESKSRLNKRNWLVWTVQFGSKASLSGAPS